MIYSGNVIEGVGIAGKDIGIPTANIDVRPDNLAFGIYAAKTLVDGRNYEGVVCYGAGDVPKFEVHLFDFSKNIYGSNIDVEVLEKISELVPWSSLERMRQKILHDIELTKAYFKKKNTQ